MLDINKAFEPLHRELLLLDKEILEFRKAMVEQKKKREEIMKDSILENILKT